MPQIITPCRYESGSLFIGPQKILYSEIESIHVACFTQESAESLKNTMSKSITDYVIDLSTNIALPIELIRPQATFEEDVYAICFILKNGDTVLTHYTWDKLSANNTVIVLKQKLLGHEDITA